MLHPHEEAGGPHSQTSQIYVSVLDGVVVTTQPDFTDLCVCV